MAMSFNNYYTRSTCTCVPLVMMMVGVMGR